MKEAAAKKSDSSGALLCAARVVQPWGKFSGRARAYKKQRKDRDFGLFANQELSDNASVAGDPKAPDDAAGADKGGVLKIPPSIDKAALQPTPCTLRPQNLAISSSRLQLDVQLRPVRLSELCVFLLSFRVG